MRRVRDAGYPVPEVFDVTPEGMVMERIDGPTMLADLGAHPWRAAAHARILADLHNRLHRIPATDDLLPRFGPAAPGDVLVHADLHPDNVMLAPSGPVVIDWANGGRGPAGADVADAWLVLAGAQPAIGVVRRMLTDILRRRFLAAFLAHAGREEAARHLRAAGERRMLNVNLTEAERAAMRRVVEAHALT